MNAIDPKALRSMLGELSPDEFRRIARERELAEWAESNKFCGRCGTGMRRGDNPAENAFVCPSCGYMAFPKICPAVIVLVTNGDRILLQRNSHYRAANWTLVAGFVDPGENLEDAVRREIREEASIEVKDIRYTRSQAWPFPSNIMIGFTAEYLSGELRPDGDEVIESGWFTRDGITEIPIKGSIARWMIDEWATKPDGSLLSL